MPETLRPLANFTPSLWGDRFSSITLDTQLLEKYSKEVQVLKEEVKDMLILGDVGAEKMVLIDTLERLGVSYLFEKEIEELLEKMFPNFDKYSHVFHDNLFIVSLHFRVFRQHGYKLSSASSSSSFSAPLFLSLSTRPLDTGSTLSAADVFKKFKDGNGEFKESISSDVMGMLSLYEATFLKTHGEDILDKAFCFTKAKLESLKPHLSPDLAEQVTHALYQSLQRGIPRVEAWNYISIYENDASRNEKLLRLAKIDFNRLQMLHKEELCEITRWWKDWDLRTHIPYVRDRAVECFFYSTANCFEPQCSLARLILTKTMIMVSVLDDTYDAYGTYEELKCFTNAVHRMSVRNWWMEQMGLEYCVKEPVGVWFTLTEGSWDVYEWRVFEIGEADSLRVGVEDMDRLGSNEDPDRFCGGVGVGVGVEVGKVEEGRVCGTMAHGDCVG
ncbi:hypothetical protein Vadar_031603 [Vaccinium darrowii]|uniref:Uncharacterized protein n=1 Tax=Vaccinium darrowii TaxID=229202 RepID=A0ACB7XLD9_9ERIC|nr:hypothetical protein Vadar_031603 [Vaccinium darrowii]